MSTHSALILFFVRDAFNRWFYGFQIPYSNGEEGLLLMFVSGFLALLFFVAGCTVISFKLYNDVQNEKRQFEKLNRIGMTSGEEARYLSIELKLLFFLPMAVGSLIVTPFVLIENLRQGQQWNHLGTYLILILVYAVIQLCLYNLAKNRYYGRIYE
jgi:ABC-type antimicrobial peptide transport system permease subunit